MAMAMAVAIAAGTATETATEQMGGVVSAASGHEASDADGKGYRREELSLSAVGRRRGFGFLATCFAGGAVSVWRQKQSGFRRDGQAQSHAGFRDGAALGRRWR